MTRQLQFGIELEMALQPREVTLPHLIDHFGFDPDIENIPPSQRQHHPVICDNKEAIKEFLRYCFSREGLPVNQLLDDGNEPEIGDEIDYSKWTMVDDPTIDANGPAYGVEIVSPIFVSDVGTWPFECQGDWQNTISRVWGLLEYWFEIVTDYSHLCDTHIHVSPLDGYDNQQVKSMARYLVHSHQRITRFLPKERQNWLFAMPNFVRRPTPSLESLTGDVSIPALVDLMMPREQDIRASEQGMEKYVAWNFLPLLESKGTIEYRQPPHVTELWEIQHWVQWSLSLFFSGINYKE